MYNVSADYITKMFDQVQTHKLTGTIDTSISFTGEDVIGVNYTNKCTDKKVSIGVEKSDHVTIGLAKPLGRIVFSADRMPVLEPK